MLHTDNAREYIKNKFKEFSKSEGVHHEYTVPKTLEQNGVTERLNRTLIEMVQSMLLDSRLPHKFWDEELYIEKFKPNKNS